jgi:succinate-acetate transporter protein
MEASRPRMEGDRPGAREADVAPAPDPTVGAGWTPADPAPLGLAGFATTTFVLSIFNANLVSPLGSAVVLPLALAFGGVAQLLAGMWEFRRGNTFGAVVFSAYGAFWISFYFLLSSTAKTIPLAHLESSIAVYLYAWAIFTTLMLVCSLRTTGAVALTLLLLTITFFLLAIGNAGASSSTIHLGGWVGLATAIVAWYTAFAAVANSTFGREMFPVFPLNR